MLLRLAQRRNLPSVTRNLPISQWAARLLSPTTSTTKATSPSKNSSAAETNGTLVATVVADLSRAGARGQVSDDGQSDRHAALDDQREGALFPERPHGPRRREREP